MNDVGERTDRQAFIHRRNQPQRSADGLQRKLVSEVQQCLRKRGYAQIRLTREQSRALGAYKPGSIERQRFLHLIASAPRDD